MISTQPEYEAEATRREAHGSCWPKFIGAKKRKERKNKEKERNKNEHLFADTTSTTRCTSTADVRRTFVYFMINKAKRSPSLPKLYGPPLCRTLASGGWWGRGKIRTRLGRVVLSCVSHQTANKIQYFLQICPLWWWLGHPLFILCLGFRRVVSLDSTWPPHLRRL